MGMILSRLAWPLHKDDVHIVKRSSFGPAAGDPPLGGRGVLGCPVPYLSFDWGGGALWSRTCQNFKVRIRKNSRGVFCTIG